VEPAQDEPVSQLMRTDAAAVKARRAQEPIEDEHTHREDIGAALHSLGMKGEHLVPGTL
jgi:hypothetical protein